MFDLSVISSEIMESCLAIFNPGCVSTPEIIHKLREVGVGVGVEEKVRKYFVRASQRPTLHLVKFSCLPLWQTLGESPVEISRNVPKLSKFQGSFLSLSDYLIAVGFVFSSTGGRFPEEDRSTFFPEICFPGGMARSDVRPHEHRLRIVSGNSSVGCGARFAIPVPLRGNWGIE